MDLYFLSRLWRSADPAAVFEFFPVLPLFNTLEAALPAFFEVFAIAQLVMLNKMWYQFDEADTVYYTTNVQYVKLST